MGRLRDPSSPRRRPLGSAARLFRFARLAVLGLERRELYLRLLGIAFSLYRADVPAFARRFSTRSRLLRFQKIRVSASGKFSTTCRLSFELSLKTSSAKLGSMFLVGRRFDFVVPGELPGVGRTSNERNSGQKDGTEQFFEMIHLWAPLQEVVTIVTLNPSQSCVYSTLYSYSSQVLALWSYPSRRGGRRL